MMSHQEDLKPFHFPRMHDLENPASPYLDATGNLYFLATRNLEVWRKLGLKPTNTFHGSSMIFETIFDADVIRKGSMFTLTLAGHFFEKDGFIWEFAWSQPDPMSMRDTRPLHQRALTLPVDGWRFANGEEWREKRLRRAAA